MITKKTLKGFSLLEILIALIIATPIFLVIGQTIRSSTTNMQHSNISNFYREVTAISTFIDKVDNPTIINHTPTSLNIISEKHNLTLSLSSGVATLNLLDNNSGSTTRYFSEITSLEINKINNVHYKLKIEGNSNSYNFSTNLEMYEIILNPVEPKNSKVPWQKEVIYFVP